MLLLLYIHRKSTQSKNEAKEIDGEARGANQTSVPSVRESKAKSEMAERWQWHTQT